MAQPPGRVDDLQPQDLSTSSLPAVLDLTRKPEECVIDPSALDALRMVKGPGWYSNAGAANPAHQFLETRSPDIAMQSGNVIPPHDAFSHTTVTLSYVSRSRIFSSQQPLSHLPLYSVPPISKFALHPPCDADKELGGSGYALNQCYVQAEEASVNVALQTEPLQSQAPSCLKTGGILAQRPGELNGVISNHRDAGESVQTEEDKVPQENREELESRGESWSSSGALKTLTPVTGEKVVEEEEVVLPVQNTPHQAVVLNRAPCSLSREYISPLEDPVSPSAVSLDDVDDVFLLPQASNSPSADNSYLEENLQNTDRAFQSSSVIGNSFETLDSSEEKQPSRKWKTLLEPLIDLTDDICLPDHMKEKSKNIVPRRNGNAKRTFIDKKLPVQRSRRAKSEDSKITKTSEKSLTIIPSNSPPLAGRKSSTRVAKKVSCPLPSLQTRPLRSRRKLSLQSSSPQPTLQNSKTEPELPSQTSLSPPPSSLKCQKNSPDKGKSKSPRSRTPPSAKTKVRRTPKKRQRKRQPCHSSSIFSPKEPEIKLKYVNYKEERREFRSDGFSPFVRLERQQSAPSLCTLVNYPEEGRGQQKKGERQQAFASGYISVDIPSTSCLKLGRVSMLSQHQGSLVCCICGRSANSMDLGDLHGPYYPEGYRPNAKAPASPSGLKEDDDGYSDSDSSSFSVKSRRRKCAGPSAPLTPTQAAQLKPRGIQAENHRRAAGSTHSSLAKRARSSSGTSGGAGDTEDWYSPPVLPLEPCEFWLHEDCGIWSAGVFLVKGKVYGLQEAVKVARVTMCSACQNPGATLGCFFKGCSNNYHYRCALDSDCVLLQENFSMKCKKHKNKTFKAPAGTRGEAR